MPGKVLIIESKTNTS